MKIDLYTKGVLTLIAVALTLIALNPWMTSPRRLPVMKPRQAEAQQGVSAIKAWGRVVACGEGCASRGRIGERQ